MKKLIVVVLVLAVLAGGAFGFYKYAQSQVLAAVDEQFIPSAKRHYAAIYGHEPEITYEKAEMRGKVLTVSGIEFKDEKLKLFGSMKTETATLKGWDWLWGDYKYSFMAEDTEFLTPESKISLKQISCPQINSNADGTEGSFEDFKIAGIEVTVNVPDPENPEKMKPETMQLGDFKLAQGEWKKDLNGRFHFDAADFSAISKDLNIKLDSLDSWAEYPGVQPNSGGWPLSKSEALFKGLQVVFEGKTFLTMEQMKSFTEIAPGLATHKSEINGILLTKELLNEEVQLAALGYDEIKADLKFDADYDQKRQLFRYKEFTMDVPQMGRVTMSIEVPGIKVDKLFYTEMSEEEAMEILGNAALKSFRFRYTDKSLVPKLLKNYADSQGTDVETIKKQAQLIIALSAGALQGNPQVAQLAKALGEFVMDPKELCISVLPAAPLKFADFSEQQDPQKMLKDLNIKTTCE